MIGITPISREGGKQVYRIAFPFRGVQCRETVALPHTKANATYCERLRAEILGKIARGDFRYEEYFPNSPRAALFGHGPGRTRTLKVALEAYRDRVKLTFAHSTFQGDRKSIDNILVPWCGHMRISEIRPSDIRDWVGVQTTSLKRIRNVLLPLRAVLDEAVDDEIIEANPLDKVKLAKLVPEARRYSTFEANPYTEEEVRTLLERLPLPQRLAFQLWAYTGMRTGELIALRWPRVDLEVGSIRVEEVTTEREDKDSPKTPASRRTIVLLPAAREAIDLLRAHTQLADDRVTVNPRSTREDKAWDDKRLAGMWKRAHQGTGIAYRNPYELRHTYASNLLSEGVNVALIAKLLGHKTIDMVIKHYGRWVSSGVDAGMAMKERRYGMKKLWSLDVAA